MSNFYKSTQSQESNVCRNRYPSYLMKVSPPQMCLNLNSSNTLLLPKICNKYSVRRSSSSVTNIINCNDVMSVKSTMEFNNTATNDYSSFGSRSRESFGSVQPLTYRNFRYPSYLMKVSPPQACSNFNSNNMILLPKICNKYSVRRSSNSVTNVINYDEVLSVKSTIELNNTTSMQSLGNKNKMTNKATTNDFTSFDDRNRDSFGNFQQPTAYILKYPSLMKVSPSQVYSDNENILMQKNNKMHGMKTNSSIIINNNQPLLDEAIKSSLEDAKSTNLNDTEIKTNKLIDVNKDSKCLALNTNDLKTERVLKIKNGINCIFNDRDNEEQLTKKEEEEVNDVKLYKFCKKCHKGWNVENFVWEKIPKIIKIKLLEIIKQNSKTEKPIFPLVNHTINNNSNQHLFINETKCLDKTQNNISI